MMCDSERQDIKAVETRVTGYNKWFLAFLVVLLVGCQNNAIRYPNAPSTNFLKDSALNEVSIAIENGALKSDDASVLENIGYENRLNSFLNKYYVIGEKEGENSLTMNVNIVTAEFAHTVASKIPLIDFLSGNHEADMIIANVMLLDNDGETVDEFFAGSSEVYGDMDWNHDKHVSGLLESLAFDIQRKLKLLQLQ